MKTGGLEKQLRVLFKTRRSIVLSGLFAILGVMLIGLVVVPQVNSIIALRQKITQEQGQLAKLKQRVIQLNQALISPEYSQVEVVDQALPSKKPILELLTSLSSTIKQSGVELEELEVSPGLIASGSAEVTGKVKKTAQRKVDESLNLSLKVSGSFNQIEDFMKKVEEISPFTTLTSFDLSESVAKATEANSDSVTTVDRATISMEIQTFFFAQSVQQVLDKPLPELTNRERETLRQLASFQTSGLEEQMHITGGGLEDLFGVKGYSEELKKLYQEAQ